jgi:type I restriction enzyme S subunit
MNAALLLEHYARIADAPDAIARLRRFVLDLAVRGKLVEQDPSDEPVAFDLQRIGSNALPEGAFELPGSWEWVAVGSVAQARLGKMLDKAKNRGTPRPYLRNINVRWFTFDFTDLLSMPFEDAELEEFALRSGDVLICEGGEPGRAAVWNAEACDVYFQKALHRVRFEAIVDPNFFVLAIRASADDGRLKSSFTGTGIQHFTGRSLDAYAFPLPPIAEQRRIVAKVDELMGLCDQLEAAWAERETARDTFTLSTLAKLNTPDPATFAPDARFALANLAPLTTRPAQIKQLRQTILNLAVRGKLVEQDAEDEQAEVLLAEFAAAKLERKRQTGDARIKPASTPKLEALPIELPTGWAVQSFENLFLFIDYRGNTPPKTEDGIPLITAKNIRMGFLNREPREFISQATFKTVNGGAKVGHGAA